MTDKALNLLVVEDSQKHIDAAKRQLEGHNIEIVTDYRSAVDFLNAAQPVDAMFTDLFIPFSQEPEYVNRTVCYD